MMRSCLRLLGLLALLSPSVVSAAPSVPPPRGTIAYTLAVDIWTVSADGTRRTRVTRGGFGFEPSWSADGKRLLFVRRRDTGIYLMRASGGDARPIQFKVGAVAGARDPDWARNGRIAFVALSGGPFSTDGRPHGIWVVNEEGSGLRELVRYGFTPAWSPDGTRIAYTQPTGLYGERVVAVIGANGGEATHIAPGGSPAWSPDGRRLAFVDLAGKIVVANADGSDQKTVVDCGGSPSWSPDGRWLAYLACRNDFRTQLYIVPSSGGTPTRITKYAGPYGAPDWRPVEPARR